MESFNPEEFAFLGYDIRLWKSGGKVSLDCSIMERPESTDFYSPEGADEFGLFPSIQSLKEALVELPENEKILAVPVLIYLNRESYQLGIDHGFLQEEPKKADVKQWNDLEFQGIDIATIQYRWLSFLSNFGVDFSEVCPDSALNSVGLLPDSTHAKAIIQFAEKKVPNHAPYGVWGIFKGRPFS